MSQVLRVATVGRAAAQLVPLHLDHVRRLRFKSSIEEHLVRDALAGLLHQPAWSWAALLDREVAGLGGFVWMRPTWCFCALAAADWVKPIDWRPFLKPIRAKLEQAHHAGAQRIETNVDGRSMKAHRLVMALGFVFQGLAIGNDSSETPWVTYARFRKPPDLPPRVVAAMWEAHGHVLGTMAQEDR